MSRTVRIYPRLPENRHCAENMRITLDVAFAPYLSSTSDLSMVINLGLITHKRVAVNLCVVVDKRLVNDSAIFEYARAAEHLGVSADPTQTVMR